MKPKLFLPLGVIAIITAGWVAIAERDSGATRTAPETRPRTPTDTPASPTPPRTAPLATPPSASSSPPPAAPAVENFPDFSPRPFAIVGESANHEWTAEDGKLPAIIRQLAHNPHEERKMVAENPAVYRRQLVYRKQAAADLLQEAQRSGAPLKTIPIPGFDGAEWMVEVYQIDTIDGGAEGTIFGRLPGQPNSLVTLSFIGPSECFSLLSPDQNLFVQGDPREPGEIIVKRINPDLMGGEEGGHPDPYDVGSIIK